MRAGASFLLDYFVVCESFLKVTRHNIFMDRSWLLYLLRALCRLYRRVNFLFCTAVRCAFAATQYNSQKCFPIMFRIQ